MNEWQSPGTTPEHPGVYERNYKRRVFLFSKWDGAKWSRGCRTPHEAAALKGYVKDTDPSRPWREYQWQ